MARLAGIRQAAIVTVTRMPVMVPNVTGSFVGICTTSDCSTPLMGHAAAKPIVEPDCELDEALAQDDPGDLTALRAEGHPHADFLGALGDRVRRDRVNPDGRQDERDRGEDREHGAEHAVGPAHVCQEVVHRPHAEDRKIGIDRLNGLPYLHRDRRRLDLAPRQDVHEALALHPVRHVDDGVGLERLRIALPDRRTDTDDRQPLGGRLGRVCRRRGPPVTRQQPDAPADRILLRESAARRSAR